MLSIDNYHFLGFNWEERVRAYEHMVTYFVQWAGISGIGVENADASKIPFFKELLMYPVLCFAAFSVVLLTPMKLFYNLMKFITFSYNTFWGWFVDNWNTAISLLDAFYMVFLSPFDVLFDFFILLPIDIIWWFTQLVTWFGINLPIMWYYSVIGFEIMYGRLYWLAMWIIFHFEDF